MAGARAKLGPFAALAAGLVGAAVACSTSPSAPGAPPDAAAPPPSSPSPDAAVTPIADAGPSADDASCAALDAGPNAFPSGDVLARGAPLPNFTFDVLAADLGSLAPQSMRRYQRPCGPPSLLVIRATAAWCGSCCWHAQHTYEWLAADLAGRLALLDLLVGDVENLPPDLAAMKGWALSVDGRHDVGVGRDATFRFRELNVGDARAPLPLYAIVETRTMTVVRVLGDPDPVALDFWLHYELATLDGVPPPPAPSPPLFDGRFFRNQWDLLHEMTAPGAPPPDPTNAHADDAAAAALGKSLFSDASLSPSGKVACASCHDPSRGLADGAPQSVAGVAPLDRNAPAIALASGSRWQFWDGRADSLWMQALGPLENAKEIASSRLFVAHAIYDRYRARYEAVFGPMPPLGDLARFPSSGQPGTAAWAAMAPADQASATRVFVDVGKTIAAYERTFRLAPSRFDGYVAGDLAALSDVEKDGLRAFFEAGCAQCHYGPRLTDDAFHVTRFGTGRQDGAPDRGRADGMGLYAASEFHAGSVWSDAPGLSRLAGLRASATMLGAFKTPTLRGAPATAPYGHGGTLATFDDVVALYRQAGLAADDPAAIGSVEPWLASFGGDAERPLVAFLSSLAAAPVVP
jgi:cytochrome c peroxidase